MCAVAHARGFTLTLIPYELYNDCREYRNKNNGDDYRTEIFGNEANHFGSYPFQSKSG